jgi:hypothetical protein
LRIIHSRTDGNSYTLLVEVHDHSSTLDQLDDIVILDTRRHLDSVSGGRLLDHTGTRYRIAIEPNPNTSSANGSEYVRATLQVTFTAITQAPAPPTQTAP